MYDEARNTTRAVRRWRPVQADYEQSVYTEAIPEEGQYTEGYGHETIYTAPVAEEPSPAATRACILLRTPLTRPNMLERSRRRRPRRSSGSRLLEPQQVELGPRCPDAYTGYFDTVPGALRLRRGYGECVYALDSDGAVFEADYRQVLWVRPYEAPDRRGAARKAP